MTTRSEFIFFVLSLSCVFNVRVSGECVHRGYDDVLLADHLEDIRNFVFTDSSGSANKHGTPHGDFVKVSFDAYGEHFEHELRLDRNTWSSDASFEFFGSDQDLNEGKSQHVHTPKHRSYVTKVGVVPRVAAYVYDNYTVHATIASTDEIYTLSSVKTKTGAKEGRKLVIYKHSALNGAAPHEKQLNELLKRQPPHSQARKLLAPNPDDPKHKNVEVWDKCWTGQANPKTLPMGLAIDEGYWNVFANEVNPNGKLEGNLAELISYTNLVYGQQMNIYLSVGVAVVMNTSAAVTREGATWNRKPPCGGTTPSDLLNLFRAWRRTAPLQTEKKDFGLWHLMTNCFPPPGVVGIAFVGALCRGDGVGVGLTTYFPGTWKTFAHEVGHNFGGSHSFEDGRGKTGGIMDYGNGLYKGVYQFNTKYRKTRMCQEVEIASTTFRGTKVCLKNGIGQNDAVKGYNWKVSTTEKYPCSVTCGGGVAIDKVFCMDDDDKKVSSTFCNLPSKPVGTTSTCGSRSCGSGVCEDCKNNCCSMGCEQSSKCASKTYQKDAGFKVPRGKYTYIFRGADYTRFEEGVLDPDSSYPRRINESFPTWDKAFHSDIDAAVVRLDGDIFLFKGDSYIRLTGTFAMGNGYPKKIQPDFRISFTSGVDAAISFEGGAYFFKGDQYVEYRDNRGQRGNPKPIGSLGIDFRDRIDAAVHDWLGHVKMYRNGKVLVYKIGVGQVQAPSTVFTIGTPGKAVACPSNCLDCTEPTQCLQCEENYKPSESKPGQCTPYIYAMDLPFDNKEYDKTQFIKYNIPDTAWDVMGNVGGGLFLRPDHRIDLRPLEDSFPQFSLHLWINLGAKSVVDTQQLLQIEFTNGKIASWDLIADIDGLGLLPRFKLDTTTIIGYTPVVPGLWKHIHADLIEGNLRVSVDAVEDRLVFEGEPDQEWKIAKWRIGAGTIDENNTAVNNGLNATLDAFHIDIEIPVYDTDAPSTTAIEAAVAMSFVSALLVLGGSWYYVARLRPTQPSDQMMKRDASFVGVLAVLFLLLIVFPALFAHETIQLAFILPMSLIWGIAAGIVIYLVHRNGKKWLWPTK